MTSETTTLTHERVDTLANELIAELSYRIGDRDAVNDVMRSTLDRLDHRLFGLVCMAAMRTTFAECMTPDPAQQAGATS